ncbi:MAG TPA: DNA internalization-related competence protein ComEC/Rec2, partial [Desulfomonilia bacterium]|nr:DNA internalization-related competence protein ComEC/Rec2 [Desulfomonilia bacterium]
VLGNVRMGRMHLKGRALIRVYDKTPEIQRGSLVISKVRVRKPSGFGNAGEFDYKRYLLSQNIVMVGVVEDGSEIKVSGGRASKGLKEELIQFLNNYSRPEAELIKAMVLGDRSGLTFSIQDRFNSLGITHLIAISGLNIGIAMMIGYGLLSNLLRILPYMALRIDGPYLSRLGGMFAAIAYTLFVGLEVPVLRACIMAVSCTAGLLFLRKSDLLEELAFAGIIILLLWPSSLYSLSFLLSFGAVLGIVGVLAKTGSAPIWFRFSAVTLAAWVFTIPLIVYHFGFVSSTGLLANSIVVPFFSLVIMPLSILGIILHSLSQTLSVPVFSLCFDANHLLLKACDLFGSLKPVPRPWMAWVYLSYIGLITAFWGEKLTRRQIFPMIMCISLFSLPILQHAIQKDSLMRFDFLSVGQGDCSLVTKGGHAVLIDAGPAQTGFDAGRHIVAPHLLRRGITDLEAVVITHMHPDHCGGIPFILERFPVGQVWINASQKNNPYFQEVTRITKEKSIPLKYVHLGDRFQIGRMTMDVLNPREHWSDHQGRMDQNLQSIVLMIQDEHMKGLFMGDADMFGELMLVHLERDITAHVLKAAHHGGEKSCLNPFLDVVCPKVAVISCGFRNRYGDPSRKTISRLREHGISLFRTDMHGEVMITSLQEGPYVKSVRIPADIQ